MLEPSVSPNDSGQLSVRHFSGAEFTFPVHTAWAPPSTLCFCFELECKPSERKGTVVPLDGDPQYYAIERHRYTVAPSTPQYDDINDSTRSSWWRVRG